MRLHKLNHSMARDFSSGLLVFFLCLYLFSGRNAWGGESIQEMNIYGTVTAPTCNISAEDKNKTVDLGNWATKQLNKTGDTSIPVAFSLTLTGCPVGTLTTVFTGDGSPDDSTLLALTKDSTASGVAIEIQDGEHNRIPLGPPGIQSKTDSEGNAELAFYADYVVVTDSVSPGSANADATFTVFYE
ncbi:fimbrial protein [Enterobacter kobei]|uniref:fimbrial protein n=1 Tax=Enterobacter kobei TaxID=208224 RepID=UPI003CE76D50